MASATFPTADPFVSMAAARRLIFIYFVTSLIALGFYVAAVWLSYEWDERDPTTGWHGSISMLNPAIARMRYPLVLAGFALPMVVTVLGGRFGERHLDEYLRTWMSVPTGARYRFSHPLLFDAATYLWFPVFLLAPIVAFLVALDGWALWTIQDRRRGPDGQEYLVLSFSVMQAQEMAIGRVECDDWFQLRARVLAMNNGDYPYSWASVVRPANPGAGDLIYFSPEGQVLVLYDNHCYIAHDPKTGQSWEHGTVERLSPFILIGPSDAMHPPDAAAIGARLISPFQQAPGSPWRSTLVAARGHPNAEVRKLAAEWFARQAAIPPATQVKVEP